MEEIRYIIRQDDSQRVFLTEDTLDVFDILEKYYGYLLDAVDDEGIILKAGECNMFKELVFEHKVVGFATYDFSRQFITAALNNIYVLPDFRGNGLFYEEMINTMREHSKPSIMEPTRLVVELLIRYGFAEKITSSIVASSIEFIVPGDHVISNGPYNPSEELSTHFFDLNLCACIHFLDIENNILAYSQPLNYDIIHYDCTGFRNSIDENYFAGIKTLFVEKDMEILDVLLDLEEKIPSRSYSLEEVVGDNGGFSHYIQSLIDDGHITLQKAIKIKNQLIEEYEAGMVLNESLLIRLAYLLEEKSEPFIKSHSDICPYCRMPIDDHDRFCHFCGINLNYDPQEMFDSLVGFIGDCDVEMDEDIRYIAYKFLKLTLQGIETEYCIFTIENTYAVDWILLKNFLDSKNYFDDGKITKKGLKFIDNHPLNVYEEYSLNMVDYTDFEKYFYENENLNKKEVVLNYLRQFGDEFLEIMEEIKDN